MNWKQQQHQIKNKLSSIAAVFGKIAKITPKYVKKIIQYSLFNFHVTYGTTVWQSITKKEIGKLQVIQDRAIKSLFQCPMKMNLKLMYSEIKIKNVTKTIKIQQCVHRYIT